jgi:hypothetical protein
MCMLCNRLTAQSAVTNMTRGTRSSAGQHNDHVTSGAAYSSRVNLMNLTVCGRNLTVLCDKWKTKDAQAKTECDNYVSRCKLFGKYHPHLQSFRSNQIIWIFWVFLKHFPLFRSHRFWESRTSRECAAYSCLVVCNLSITLHLNLRSKSPRRGHN